MKGIYLLMAIIAVAWPGDGPADVKTVICDGCGETEYSRAAIQAADFNDVVLVVDGQERQLRKYVVMTVEDFDGGGLQTTAYRMAPSPEESGRFAASVDVIDRLESGIEACGPGSVGDWAVPDLWFDWACERHDQCYTRGGDDDDRQDCDRGLYWDMRALGATHGLAAAYFMAVRSTGWLYFNYHRNGWSSSNPLFGCNFLIVCDYTSMVQLPG